jgi:predicted small secreted protein
MSCSNTWEGIKEDSKELGNSIGKAAENTGKSIQEVTE